MSEACKQYGCCMCQDVYVGVKPHLKCCNCGRTKMKVATPVPPLCPLTHYPHYLPIQTIPYTPTITWNSTASPF